VSALRPKAPVVRGSDCTVLEVAVAMSEARTDACLLVEPNGMLAGIVTDTDLARRVAAAGLDAAATRISAVMTAGPMCVSMDDSALDALGTMLDRHFRHLPVLGGAGSDHAVVGVLDIAKCLYDAISRLQKVARKSSEEAAATAAATAAAVEAAAAAMQAGMRRSGSRRDANLLALMQQALAPVLGGAAGGGGGGSATLGDVLKGSGREARVAPGESVEAAAAVMARCRKAVLVLAPEDGSLVGILTPKDIQNRVLAKGRSAAATAVADVMTPNPDGAPPDLTLIEALRQMHESRYLHLPVVAEGGAVLGLV
ncbi:unnamed protein product, partial [Phaeothamnion confervicola]